MTVSSRGNKTRAKAGSSKKKPTAKKAAARKPSAKKAAAKKGTAKKAETKAPSKSEGKAAKAKPAAATKSEAAGAPTKRKKAKKGPPPKFDIPAYSSSQHIGAEELEFIEALNSYKEQHGRLFPKQSEILHVLRHLGYRKQS